MTKLIHRTILTLSVVICLASCLRAVNPTDYSGSSFSYADFERDGGYEEGYTVYKHLKELLN